MPNPFVSGSYDLDSRPASVQRTVNMMPVPIEPGNEREGWVFKDVPGLVSIDQIIPPAHTCPNGPAWEQTVKTDKRHVGMYYLKDKFVAPYLSTGSVAGGVSYSVDGETWTDSNTFPDLPVGEHITSVAYGNSIFVAYGNWTTLLFYSTDAITWTSVVAANVSRLSTSQGIWFGGGNFVILGSGNLKLFHGPNADTMTEVADLAENMGCGVYMAGAHYAGALNSGNVYSSTDLDTWSLVGAAYSGGSNALSKMAAGAGVLVALDHGEQQNFVSYSLNGGVTWLHSTGLPLGAAFYVDVLYLASQDLWMLTDDDGFVYLSHDGAATWELAASTLNPFLGTNQNWWMAAHPDGFLYAAVPVTAATSTVAALGTC